MKYFIAAGCILLISLCSFSQQFYIKGRVLDGTNKQPLKGASVYINNSTKGTVADETGEYTIGPLDPGNYEIVASFVGYASLLYKAEINNNSVKVSFELGRKEKPLREVLILTDETRRRYLDLFKKNVLGYTSGAERCRIKNIEEVIFISGNSKEEIQAVSDNELVIENPELGYTIYFELIDFYYNRSTSSTYFFGYTRYKDWGDEDGKTKSRWLRKRRQVYEGSTVHFFRSLINQQLKIEGFDALQLLQPPPPKIDTMNKGTLRIGVSKESFQMAKGIKEEDMFSLYSDSGYKVYELKIGDGWRINYDRNTDLKFELASQKIFLPGQPVKGTSGGLRKRQDTRDLPVLVTHRGVLLTPMNVLFDGIWAYERLANMLPEDYEPEK
jgi:hypothetical protein